MMIRSPLGLMILGRPDGVTIYDPGACTSWNVDAVRQPELVGLLAWCAEWRAVGEAEAWLGRTAGATAQDARATLAALLDDGLLVSDEEPTYRTLGDRDRAWTARGWQDPLEFHWNTNCLPKMDYAADPRGSEDKAIMAAYLASGDPPEPYKRIAGPRTELAREVRATTAAVGDAFAHDVGAPIASSPLTRDELSTLLYLTYGQTATRKLPVTGVHVAKTSPSGGSRHPTEVYPIVLAADDVAPGLYHYDVEKHALVELRSGDHRRFVQEHVITHPSRPGFTPAVAFIHTTIFERSMFRYREGRSYRVMQYDLGHIMQTGALVASALGRCSYRAYSFHDEVVERFLGVDGILESAMTFTLVG